MLVVFDFDDELVLDLLLLVAAALELAVAPLVWPLAYESCPNIEKELAAIIEDANNSKSTCFLFYIGNV